MIDKGVTLTTGKGSDRDHGEAQDGEWEGDGEVADGEGEAFQGVLGYRRGVLVYHRGCCDILALYLYRASEKEIERRWSDHRFEACAPPFSI